MSSTDRTQSSHLNATRLQLLRDNVNNVNNDVPATRLELFNDRYEPFNLDQTNQVDPGDTGGDVDEPHGTGSGTVDGTATVRADPNSSGDAVGEVTGDVVIVGQTTADDGTRDVWYQVEYTVDGETRTGWVYGGDVDNEQIDWREGDPIRLYNASGAELSAEDAELYVQAAAAQQEMLEDYGIEVGMPVGTPQNGQAPVFRPLTPQDAEVMLATLEQVRALEDEGGYGVDLQTHGRAGATIPWTPDEIGAVYGAVTSAADAAYAEALAMGYDVESPQQVFRDVYGSDGELVIRRENRRNFDGGAYAWNYGGGVIGLSHFAFYNSGNVLAAPGSFNPDFTPMELIAHELGHQVRGLVDPDYTETGSYTLQSNYTISYTNERGELVTETIPAGTVVTLDSRDEGYQFAARSSNSEVEVETDAATAATVGNAYSIGGQYSRDANLAGLARQEQGQAILQLALQETYGDPPAE